LPAVARSAKAGCLLPISSFGWQARIPDSRGSFGCLFLLYGVLSTVCGQIERLERVDPAFERPLDDLVRSFRKQDMLRFWPGVIRTNALIVA
jgi:hypothetical protein